MKIEQIQWPAKAGWPQTANASALGESVQVAFLFGSANLIKASDA